MTTVSLGPTLRTLVLTCALAFVVAPVASAAPLTMTFVNENTTYAPGNEAYFLFSYTDTPGQTFDATVLGTGPKSGPMSFTEGAGPSAGSFFSESYSITDLADGIQITEAPSTRIYVSLGQPLDAKADPMTPNNPFSSFGIPSSTAGTADPNWNVRWDFFETTLSNPRSPNDYGDLSLINQFAIPLRVEIYKSATEQTQPNLLQTAESSPAPLMLREALRDLANANQANNNFAGLPGNWYFETSATPGPSNPYPSTFLRMVGPASGGTSPEWIGPFPSMNKYAEFVANTGGTPIETSLQDTTSIKDTVQQTYDMTTTASFTSTVPAQLTGIKVSGTVETSTWDAMGMTWNPPTPNGKTYLMEIALDTNVGQPMMANYSLSNALYGSAWQNNSGITYWIDDGKGAGLVSVTKAVFLTNVSSNSTMALQTVNQWMQNLFVGYNFGLIGNTQTVSNLPNMHPLTGVTLNDMGSLGWAELKALIDVGTLATADVPFFTLTDGQSRPLYNEWARIVFESSETAYGMQYSDMFQPLLALYTDQTNFVDNVYQTTAEDVLSWKVTIRSDVPEPGAVGSLVALITLVAMRRVRARRDARVIAASIGS